MNKSRRIVCIYGITEIYTLKRNPSGTEPVALGYDDTRWAGEYSLNNPLVGCHYPTTVKELRERASLSCSSS